jgi:FSR family fosmidomycin resistance protein-like MFS transporter
MDLDPDRHEQNMARWVLAGSVGVVAGPLALGAAAALGLGWRGLYLVFAGLAVVLLTVTRRVYPTAFPDTRRDPGQPPKLARECPRQVEDSASPKQSQQKSPSRTPELVRGRPQQVEESTCSDRPTFKAGVVNALRALRRPEVLRWLTLLAFSDLMLDVLLGFLVLYFVDVVGTTPAQAGMAVAVWTGLALVGDLLLIPLLERVHGLSYLRLSAATELALLPALLLTPGFGVKLVLLALLGLFSAGWYSILKAQLYSAMRGQSGTVMTVGNVFGLVGGLIPLGLGLIAERFDLTATMWLLLLGPVALLIGIPGGLGTLNRQGKGTHPW